MQQRLPEFLGLGTQKGGTTTLQRLLEQHPQVYLPPRKELHYFSLHYSEGETWYRQQFAEAAPDQRCGEITPYYLFHPQAPARIHALLPEAKLIVLLRDPVERALSQVFHSRRLGLEPFDLEKALAAEPERLKGAEELLSANGGRHRSHQEHSYVARSRYELQLERWLMFFPREQLFLRRSEDLFEQPEQVWKELQDFLQLEVTALPTSGRRSHFGSGEIKQLDQSQLIAVRSCLYESLAPTYLTMSQRFGLRWS